MLRLVLHTFFDRWSLFVGTILAVSIGVALVHAGITVVLGTENVPAGLSREQADAFKQAASGANTLTGMSVLLSAFLTIFVVASTVSFAVDQRRNELAVLRLSGVTAQQLRGLVMLEACVAAALGAGLGALLGVIFAQVQRFILVKLGTLPADFPLPFLPAVLLLDVMVAGAVCLFGGWGTARQATRIRPLEALRRNEERQNPMTPRRWVSASIALLLTAVQVCLSAVASGMLVPLLLGLGIIITASVAMSNFAPLLVPAVARLLSRPTKQSPMADLAVSNLRDAVQRTTACAAPMIVLASLVMGLQETKAGATETTRLLRADLVAAGKKMDLPAVRAIPGIALAAPETIVPLNVRLKSGEEVLDGPGTVVAVDPVAFRKTHVLRPVSGSTENFGPDNIVFGPGLEHSLLHDHYDRIMVNVDGQHIPLREVARLPETLAGTDGFYIDRSILPAEMLNRPGRVLLQLKAGSDLASIKQALKVAGATSVQTPAEAARSENTVKDAENRGVMVAIVGLGSLYALISLLSTVAISIGQRKSEFATLQLSGVTRKQLRQVTVLEVLAVTGIGLLLGAGAAVLSLIGLWAATARIYGTPVVAIPWGLLAGLVLLTSVMVALTAVSATRIATREPALRGFEYQG